MAEHSVVGSTPSASASTSAVLVPRPPTFPPTTQQQQLVEPRPLYDPSQWQVVLRSKTNNSNRVVLYNQQRGKLSVAYLNDEKGLVWKREGGGGRGKGVARDDDDDDDPDLEVISTESDSEIGGDYCPLCRQSIPKSTPPPPQAPAPPPNSTRLPLLRDSHYFSLLSESRQQTPRTTRIAETVTPDRPFEPSAFNDGYFNAFFTVLETLGKGGSGKVSLVRHSLNETELGLYACKQIAVGNSSARLPQLLREVRMLERLQHPNIIPFHHCWVENSRLTPYGPPIPTLHILMHYANGGSLESFISGRLGSISSDEGTGAEDRRRRFRMRNTGSVHLLSLELILAIFEDVVEGLEYLHDRNILHLDLKAGNVLLDWEEDALTPRAKLSDFGSSDSTSSLSRSSPSLSSIGTLDYLPPEALIQRTRIPDRSHDMWGLGLILHLLIFFTLPYDTTTSDEELEQEIKQYQGFLPTDAVKSDHGVHHKMPLSLLRILSRLLNRNPSRRPSCEEVLEMIRDVKSEGSQSDTFGVEANALIVPMPQRNSSSGRTPTHEDQEPMLGVSSPNEPTGKERPLLSGPSPRLVSSLGRLQRSGYFALIQIFKAYSIQRHCRPGSLSTFAFWFVILGVLSDLLFQNPFLSFGLLLLHGSVMGIVSRGLLCEAQFEAVGAVM